MRLIDVDKAIKDLKQYIYDCNLENIGVVLPVIRVLEQQPTAFDVDKVMEQIDDCQSYYVGRSNSIYKKCTVELEKVLEIVERGGIDENM